MQISNGGPPGFKARIIDSYFKPGGPELRWFDRLTTSGPALSLSGLP